MSRLTGLEPYVIRYWETEFEALSPLRAGSTQRLYRRRDVETLVAIRRLLYEEKYTIAGARRRLQELAAEAQAQPDFYDQTEPSLPDPVARLREIAVELRLVLKALA